MESNSTNRVNCVKCKHYTVTWNKRFPYACKLLGFQSATMPSVLAYKSTGSLCEHFELKETHGSK